MLAQAERATAIRRRRWVSAPTPSRRYPCRNPDPTFDEERDFFAFGEGISFSIPEKAKPGIYARVRAIVRAESLWAALAGATVLAVLVNVIELVCTAGLPALYTQVLVQQGVSPGARYGYLALYNVAYMFDDSVMVGIAVVTLGRRKLQERAGRWLKLVGGVAIGVLGLLLLFAPGALVW